MIDIGKKIKALRQNAKVSQSAFAIDIGVHYQSVSKWERDLVTPDLSTLDVIIKYFNISFEYFFEIERDDGVIGHFSAENLSRAITLIRKNASLSQSEFAEKIDANIDKISKWERGVTLPSLEEIMRIAQEFNLPPSAVYYGLIEQKTDDSQNPIITVKNPSEKIKRWLIAACTLFSVLIIAICISTPIIVKKLNSLQNAQSTQNQSSLDNLDNDLNSSSYEKPPLSEDGYCSPILNPIMLHGYHELIHQSTLHQYVVHDGLDINAEVGQNVYSMLTGTVIEISKDEIYGWQLVKLTDNCGLTVVYRYCKAREGLARGDTVAAGDIIGTVTKVSYYERSLPSHLHVETYLNGQPQNPEDYFTVSPPETNYE